MKTILSLLMLVIFTINLGGCEGNMFGINARYNIDGKYYNNIGGYDCPRYRRVNSTTIACIDDGEVTRYVRAMSTDEIMMESGRQRNMNCNIIGSSVHCY